MVKQKIYLIDTGYSALGDSIIISGYTQVASGAEILINATSVGMVIGKSVNADVNLGRTTSTGLYEEGSVQHNSVSNRTYNISGVLDNKLAADQLLYKYLIQITRSPAIFAMINELTKYSDDPQYDFTTATLGTHLTAHQYQYVTFNNFSPMTRADDNNIIDYSIEAVLVNDWCSINS